MRKGNEQKLEQVINELIDSYQLRDKINEVKLLRGWEALMGEAIARRTTTLRLRKGKLFIRVSSAPLRQELFNSRDRIKELFNKELEGSFIEEVQVA